MNCNTVEERMSAYIADNVSKAEAAAVAAHLLTCSACRAWHEAVRETWGLWHDDAHADAPDLVATVMQRLQNPRQRPFVPSLPLWRVLVHYGVAASAAAVMFSLGLFDRYGYGVLHLHAKLEQFVSMVTVFLSGGAV